MAIVDKSTQLKVGAKAAKTAAKHPRQSIPAAKVAIRLAAPVVMRKVLSSAQQIGTTTRETVVYLVTYGPPAAENLGLVQRPKPKRTSPRVAAGVLIGAGAMYFFGPERRRT